jgi:hypothetical protein
VQYPSKPVFSVHSGFFIKPAVSRADQKSQQFAKDGSPARRTLLCAQKVGGFS